MTLVSGTNGSGKSAVMQGLQTCLGVSARSTGRSKSLNQFIRTGADFARVKVRNEASLPECWNQSRCTKLSICRILCVPCLCGVMSVGESSVMLLTIPCCRSHSGMLARTHTCQKSE